MEYDGGAVNGCNHALTQPGRQEHEALLNCFRPVSKAS